MYKRAMKKLNNYLLDKGLTPEKSLDKNKFDLFHFHIEAFDD
jgi:hypothetical protein